MTLDQLGAVDTATQTYDEARSYFHQALEIARDIQDIPLALNSLVGLAKLLRVNGSKEQAFELLSFVIYHPECPDDTLDEGERLLYELEGEVAPEVLDSIWGKGKDKDFALVLQDILK
jgi:hypothetical protein